MIYGENNLRRKKLMDVGRSTEPRQQNNVSGVESFHTSTLL